MLAYQYKDLERISKELTKHFCNIYDWFVDRKLSIYSGKIKLNLSFSLPKTKRGDINIKQYSKVAYLDCELHILIMLVQIDIQICVKIKSKF